MSFDISDDRSSNPSDNRHLLDLTSGSITRRGLMKAGLGAAALGFLGGPTWLRGAGDAEAAAIATGGNALRHAPISFAAIAASSGDSVVIPPGYIAEILYRWGDPITPRASDFNPDASQGWQAQELQSGDNHDGMHFFPLPGWRGKKRGLLAINHEYINPEYFYAPGNASNWLEPWNFDKAKKGLAGHGISVIEVAEQRDRSWAYLRSSRFNRRLTGYSPMLLTGPAAGDPSLRTADDPTGTQVLGTLNNCANGFTPWGTYLTCEENFNGYFANPSGDVVGVEDQDQKFEILRGQSRYGITTTGFGYRWHEVDPRFDASVNPNEPNRFGWVVEIDPYDPASTPKKRTALGRMKHENAELVIAQSGKVVVYMGDDERNEYLYKFVSDGTFVPRPGQRPDDVFDLGNPSFRRDHMDLLDSGTLYVARFDAGVASGDRAGTGVWIPLVWGENGLTEANGFASQADVLIRTRQAADRVGATMMDRPEWIAANPHKPGEVYCTLTNNNRRGSTPASINSPDGNTSAGTARPPVDEANPRTNNVWGHIIRWNEANGDPTASTFTWDIFVLAGQPSLAGERSPSPNINAGNLFNSPDGLAFDAAGRLWVQTDGNFSNSGDFAGMGNNQMLCANAATGEIRRFLVGPSGCEVTGVTWTPDLRTMFINIQHPGELSAHPNAPAAGLAQPAGVARDTWVANNPTAFSRWPEGASAGRPRSATVVVRRLDGGVIGT